MEPNTSLKSLRDSRHRSLLLWGGAIGGVIAIAAIVFACRWVAVEMAKAAPIPGITIKVDTGNAIDAKGVEHAAHAYLNRRLRELGYHQPDVNPIRIEVSFKKNGKIKYAAADKEVAVDKVELEIAFYDQGGQHLKSVVAAPKMHGVEKFKYDAEISLNKAIYNRAVSLILELDLPRPHEL